MRKGTPLAQNDSVQKGKEAAGVQAAQGVSPGMVLGLGTGSTVAFFLEALGGRYRAGEIPGIVGVPTSVRTAESAQALGIPLTTLEEAGSLDLMVDGADEVDPRLNLIKGLGGALLREKMVAQATRRMVVIVDGGKVVDRLGTQSPVPIEVVPFGWASHVPFLEGLGGHAVLRKEPDGEPFVTDNGNLILHCRFDGGISNAPALEMALAARAGIVETGLFLGMAKEVLVGTREGVSRMFVEETGPNHGDSI
ncbi:ribose-5-phosphate isomerase RpiA [Gemmatimonadota bacterium]